MKRVFYLLKVKPHEEGEAAIFYVAKQMGSGASSKSPYYLTCVPDFAVKNDSILALYELIIDLNKSNSFVSKRDLTVVQFNMELEQMSFAIPKIILYDNLLDEKTAEKMVSLDKSLLSEKELEKFNKLYEDEY